MTRLLKRYGSRKLYDTGARCYISLGDVAVLIRSGARVRVVDNRSGRDVTAPTLAQVISDEGRRGSAFLTSDLLHAVLRAGGAALSDGVEQLQGGMDRLLRRSLARMAPIEQAPWTRLGRGLGALETLVAELEGKRTSGRRGAPRRGRARAGR